MTSSEIHTLPRFALAAFDFTAILVRAVWGKVEERQREIQGLADVYRRVSTFGRKRKRCNPSW